MGKIYDLDENDETLTGDEAILQEIRERYEYAKERWRKIREESQTDRRYIAGDPWSADDRKARKDANRPCMSHDELSQYVNHAVNNARQNKKGIKIDPVGDTDEKESELRQDIIRTAEYRSRAQAAYLTAYQAMLEGSYGFFGIKRRYVENDKLTPENFNQQELAFRTFANQDSVLPDADCKEPDWSDQGYCFVLDPITREEFHRQHPHAQYKDFTSDQQQAAKSWIGGDRIILRAEYWKVETTEKKVYLVDGRITDKKPAAFDPEQERTQVKKTVVQYITNGVEILKKNPQPGTMIPIIPVAGLERYIDEGAGPERKLFSLVRLAREPQLSLAFLVSQQMEEAGMTPKVPYVGYVGQFETDAEAWEHITKIGRGYIQVDPIVDKATGAVLPLPQRVAFTPNFEQYEIAKDSARRAIQAAMGISPLPTAAQRNNEKSGVAIENIEKAQEIGSFHFVDNFERALMYAGRVMNEYIEAIHTDEQDMMLLKPDDTHRRVRLNTPEPYLNEKTGEQEHHQLTDGSQTVTVSSAPSHASQRAEVKDFVDLLIQNLKGLPIPPPAAAKLLAIAIRMKELGPKGDELADLISPPEQPGKQIPPEAQQAIQQAQQMMQAMQEELQKLQAEKAGKIVDNQFKMQIEDMKIEADLAKAEIMTKAQSLEERMKFVEDAWAQLHSQAHETAMQSVDHAHAQDMGAQQADAASQAQASDQAHAQQMQAQEPQQEAA